MALLRDFEGRLVVLPVEQLRMPITLRVPPIEGLSVTESTDTGWLAWDEAEQQQDRRAGRTE